MVRPSNCVPLRGHGIEFDQVSFAYTGTGREVLQDVSFKIVEGGMTAIVGPSGSGKSTLAKLLVSFWEADRGRILLGGVDVRKLPLSQVMQSVAYVSQDNFLFNASLRENIRLGRPDATDREVEEAAEAAACGFIKALPGGYDTPAGDAGARLSGGERQRIAIARAMLKDSPIVVEGIMQAAKVQGQAPVKPLPYKPVVSQPVMPSIGAQSFEKARTPEGMKDGEAQPSSK